MCMSMYESTCGGSDLILDPFWVSVLSYSFNAGCFNLNQNWSCWKTCSGDALTPLSETGVISMPLGMPDA